MKHPFRQFAADTRANPRSVNGLGKRLAPELADPEDVRAYLVVAPTVSSDAEARVLARLGHGARDPSRRRPVLLVVLLAAALALWAVQTPPVPLAGALSAPEWRRESPTEQVDLAFLGEGTLGGTSVAPRIDWRAGTLRVEVEPDRGVKLSVQTREAIVRVIGTGFSVDRGALGTTVAVTHGRVSVDCTGGPSVFLGAGETRVCLPTTPAALLGRARALSATAAPPEDVLATVEAGLAAGPDDPVREELEVAWIDSLGALGRWDEAYDVANLALAHGATARHEDLLHLRARSAAASRGCSAATSDLIALFHDGKASPPELVSLADCVATSDVELARRALQAALDLGVPEALRHGVESRLAGLPQ